MEERPGVGSEIASLRLLASVGALSGAAAHEVNGSLGAIVATAELALIDLEAGDREVLADALKSLVSTALRAALPLRELALARSDPGPMASEDLNAIVREECDRESERMEPPAPRIDLDLLALPAVWIARSHVALVVRFLVRDALRGGASGKITIRTESSKGGALLVIRDAGTDIPREALPSIFDPVVASRPGGQGARRALPICRAIVEGQGGTIEADSTSGAGTTLSVWLPPASPE